MNNLLSKLFFLINGIVLVAIAHIIVVSSAWCSDSSQRLAMIVLPKAVIKGEIVTLGEIARILPNGKENELFARKLSKVVVTHSPPPRSSLTLIGARILDLIEDEGISRDSIGYSIPQTIFIERSGRIIQKNEVVRATHEALRKDSELDLQVKDVTWSHAQVVGIGDTHIEVACLGEPANGRVPLRVVVYVDETPAVHFLATAIVDDWREIPVLGRTMERGMLISPEDVQIVRVNLGTQPSDVVRSIEDLIGLRVKRRIPAGKTVRAKLINIPPVISKGSMITLRYRVAGFEASASGVAMEDGLDGETIRVKNTASRKIVTARVVDRETVEVSSK